MRGPTSDVCSYQNRKLLPLKSSDDIVPVSLRHVSVEQTNWRGEGVEVWRCGGVKTDL